jgi:hypothetical protein
LGDDCKYFAIVPPVLVIDKESDEEDEKPGLKRENIDILICWQRVLHLARAVVSEVIAMKLHSINIIIFNNLFF